MEQKWESQGTTQTELQVVDLHLKAYHDGDYDNYDLDNCAFDGDDKKKPPSHTYISLKINF